HLLRGEIELCVGERRVQDHRAASVARLQRGRRFLGFCRTLEIADAEVQDRLLRVHVEQRWSRTLEREWETDRISKSRPGDDLREILVPNFAIGCVRARYVCRGSLHLSAILQRKFDCLPEG